MYLSWKREVRLESDSKIWNPIFHSTVAIFDHLDREEAMMRYSSTREQVIAHIERDINESSGRSLTPLDVGCL